jgi:ribosome-binding factor A
MSRRTERISNLIRNTIGQLLLSKLSDPRIDPARVSVTRVEVPEDLLTARVFVSVIGEQGEQRAALRALRRAAGHLQELMMRQVRLRHTPVLEFHCDDRFKKTLETLRVIQQVSDEMHRKDQERADRALKAEGGSPTANQEGEP